MIPAPPNFSTLLHFYQTPGIFRRLSRDLLWKIPTTEPEIYLTFDDGPIPGLTEFILEVLADFDARATFFCVGDNVNKHPAICAKVVKSGHLIGNHTYNHLNGWATKNELYLNNIEKCQSLISRHQDSLPQPVFRPPYGKISSSQIKALRNKYQIIMWDILAYDFDKSHSPQKSLEKIIYGTNAGSIVVFHDNYKTENKLKYMLPRYLEYFREKGYVFKKLAPAKIDTPVS